MTHTRPLSAGVPTPIEPAAPSIPPPEPPGTGEEEGGTAEPVDAVPEVMESTVAGMAERCGWSLAWLGVLIGGIDLWGSWTSWSLAAGVAPLLIAVSIGGLVATWLVRSPRRAALQVAALVTASVSILGNEGAGIHLRQFYTTDSAAFTQLAARLVQRGIDPYTASLAPAERFLQTPAAYWTYTMGGGHVTQASYPAGSFLLEVPVLALGFRHQIVDWTDLVAWVVTGVLLFVLVPASVRWFAVLLFSVPIFAAIFGSGGTDAVFLPFLLLAVWRWDRFGTGRGAGLAGWLGPVALGLACSIKQTPWFCVPFLVVGVYLEARAAGRRPLRLVARYLSIVVGVFAVVNLPFIVRQPSAWLHGTLLPLTHPLVADGQGLITVALHGIARGVSFPRLTAAALCVLAALLIAMVAWYPTMKRIWMLLLPLAFFVAPRSLLSYLLDLYPAAIVAAISVAPAVDRGPTGERRRLLRPAAVAFVVPAVAAVMLSILAFMSSPLDLTVRSVAASHTATSFDAVTLTVRNTTDGTVTPHFMVSIGADHPDGFWYPPDRRPVVLGPHASKTVTITPIGYTGAPAHGTHWLVEAYTTSPEALSTTGLLFWTLGKPPAQTP